MKTNGTFMCVDEAMSHLLSRIVTAGVESSPRGKKVRELIGQSITFDMRYPIVTKPSREIGYRFYPAEAAWILQGRKDMGYWQEMNMPFFWEYSDDGFFYDGAYGPPVVEQLSYVCDALANDHDTRQAVINVWRPNPRPSRDIPCTLSFQFIARDGRLHCVQSMRSSDAWLGYPYDVFNASMLSSYVILLLRERKKLGRTGLELGNHTMQIGSSHVYEAQWEKALAFVDDDETFDVSPFNPHQYDSPRHLVETLYDKAKSKHGIDPRKQK